MIMLLYKVKQTESYNFCTCTSKRLSFEWTCVWHHRHLTIFFY